HPGQRGHRHGHRFPCWCDRAAVPQAARRCQPGAQGRGASRSGPLSGKSRDFLKHDKRAARKAALFYRSTGMAIASIPPGAVGAAQCCHGYGEFMSAIIEIENLSKVYADGFTALSNIDLSI